MMQRNGVGVKVLLVLALTAATAPARAAPKTTLRGQRIGESRREARRVHGGWTDGLCNWR
jgi:hypothetical protein